MQNIITLLLFYMCKQLWILIVLLYSKTQHTHTHIYAFLHALNEYYSKYWDQCHSQILLIHLFPHHPVQYLQSACSPNMSLNKLSTSSSVCWENI